MSGGTFQAGYYCDSDGNEPVGGSLAGLDDEVRDALVNQIDRLDLLRDEPTHLPIPHGSEIDPKLRERCCNYGRQLHCM